MSDMKFNFFFFGWGVAMATAVTAVGQMPGSVKVTTSKLDGERQVQVTPGWLKGDRLLETTPKLGGFWSDKASTNFTLEAVLVGGGVPEKLKIGIDSRISEFTPDAAAPGTAYNPSLKVVETSKRFHVPLAFVQEMMTGTNVVVQVGDARVFREGVFSADGPTRARPGFKKALEKIQNPDGAKKSVGQTRKPPR
jgi:hypothetical protein